MVRQSSNARLKPGDRRAAGPIRAARVGRLAATALAIALAPLAGCANFVSPLSQWGRAAYDGNLFKHLELPEEMSDVQRLDRFHQPRPSWLADASAAIRPRRPPTLPARPWYSARTAGGPSPSPLPTPSPTPSSTPP